MPTPRRRRRGATAPTATPDAIVDCAAYIDGDRVPELHTTRSPAIDWVRAAGPRVRLDRPARARRPTRWPCVAELFGLHELAVEDAVHAYQRPKMDRYDNSLFLVLKTVCYVEHTARVRGRRSSRTARS